MNTPLQRDNFSSAISTSGSSIDLTVAIRTYNSESNVDKLLQSLKNQIGTEHISWEVLVVDNNSSDDTVKNINRHKAEWFFPYPLRCCVEYQQGAAFARKRAIQEAKGELIGFLDDDNFPTETWVASIVSFSHLHPKAGAYGSQVHGDFEVEPPPNFNRIQAFLAIKEHGPAPRLYDADKLDLPAGAGMAIRKQVWLQHVPDQLKLQGPVGKSLSGKGEDFEALIHIARSNWEIWYNPDMEIYHYIPKSRLEKEYLINLVKNAGFNVCTLRLAHAKSWQILPISLRVMIGNLKRLIRGFFQHRKEIGTDTVATCELAFFWSSFLSPFYYLIRII